MGGLPSLLGSSVGKKISTDVLLARAAVVAVTVAVSISPVMAVRVVCRSAVAVKMWTAKITEEQHCVRFPDLCLYWRPWQETMLVITAGKSRVINGRKNGQGERKYERMEDTVGQTFRLRDASMRLTRHAACWENKRIGNHPSAGLSSPPSTGSLKQPRRKQS